MSARCIPPAPLSLWRASAARPTPEPKGEKKPRKKDEPAPGDPAKQKEAELKKIIAGIRGQIATLVKAPGRKPMGAEVQTDMGGFSLL